MNQLINCNFYWGLNQNSLAERTEELRNQLCAPYYREAVICNSSQEKQIQPHRQRSGRVHSPCHAWSIISISILEGNNMTQWVKQQIRTVALHYCSTSLIFGSYLTSFSLSHFPYHKTFRWDSGWIFMGDSLGYEDEKGVEKEQLFHS